MNATAPFFGFVGKRWRFKSDLTYGKPEEKTQQWVDVGKHKAIKVKQVIQLQAGLVAEVKWHATASVQCPDGKGLNKHLNGLGG